MMHLTGKTALITGANSGVGYETALDFYTKGAKVIMACRNEEKAHEAITKIKAHEGNGELIFTHLDLSSLESVKRFTQHINGTVPQLDILVNNAGIMIPPPAKSIDGFEIQFAVNFIGHFALTGQLFDLLESTKGSRVITLSSIAHRQAVIDFDNFCLEKPYKPWREYGQSKLADLIFAIELDKRLKNNNNQLKSLASHPGFCKTDLQKYMDPDMLASLELMTAKQGAQPTIAACLSEEAQGGQYWGPNGPNEQKGEPGLANIDAAAKDASLNDRLWNWAKDTTETDFPF